LATTVQQRAVDDPGVAEFLRGQAAYVFQEPVWLRVLATLGYQVEYYTLEEGGRIVLAQPAARMQLGFFRLLYCGLPYGGPAGDVSRTAEFLEALRPVARREGFHRVRLSHNFYDPDPGDLPGCQVQEAVQQVLHLAGRTQDEVWEALKSRTRRDVRLAERRGVVVESASDAAARDELFGMYTRTMARNETFVVWKRQMIEAMWHLLVAPGGGEMLLAKHEGQTLAGLVSIYSGKRCFYFLGASSRQMRNLCPNDAVIWEAIRRAHARGCEDFDLMIAAAEDAPLIEFKSKWDSTQHPFRFYESDLSTVWCWAWNVSFRILRTPLGGRLARLLRRA
jgi:hypothetical protein